MSSYHEFAGSKKACYHRVVIFRKRWRFEAVPKNRANLEIRCER